MDIKEITKEASGLRFEENSGKIWEIVKFVDCGKYPDGFDVIKVGKRGKTLKPTSRNESHFKVNEIKRAIKEGWIELI